MFKTTPATEPAPVVMDTSDPVPLSVLELDLPAPTTGWLIELDRRGIEVLTDDIGRKAITRADARQLFDERRESEARQQEAVKRRDIEIEAQRVAGLRPGVPWYEIPAGVLPVVAMTQAAHDAQPRRVTPLQEALSNSGTLTFHSLASTPDESDES